MLHSYMTMHVFIKCPSQSHFNVKIPKSCGTASFERTGESNVLRVYDLPLLFDGNRRFDFEHDRYGHIKLNVNFSNGNLYLSSPLWREQKILHLDATFNVFFQCQDCIAKSKFKNSQCINFHRSFKIHQTTTSWILILKRPWNLL